MSLTLFKYLYLLVCLYVWLFVYLSRFLFFSRNIILFNCNHMIKNTQIIISATNNWNKDIFTFFATIVSTILLWDINVSFAEIINIKSLNDLLISFIKKTHFNNSYFLI